MLTIKTHLKSLVTSSLYLSNVGTLVLRSISLGRVHPSFAKEGYISRVPTVFRNLDSLC